MRHAVAALLILAAAPAAAAAAAAQEHKVGAVTVDRPVMRASIGRSPNTAGYMVLRNAGTTPDRLLSAACACARAVEVHGMSTAGGRMVMRPGGPVVIPAGGEVAFRPGGLHLMITGLKAPVAPGAARDMTLTFEKAGSVKASFQAVTRVDAPPAAAMAGHAH